MSTTDLIALLLEMRESQFVCEPGSMAHTVLKEAAERMAALHAVVSPMGQSKKTWAVAIQFDTNEERDEFVKRITTFNPNLKFRNL